MYTQMCCNVTGYEEEENTKETVVFRGQCKQTRAMKNNGGQEKQNQTDKHCSKIVLGPVFSL